MGYRSFNMGTDVNARNCRGGCTDTVRESALKAALGEKNLLTHRGIKHALAAGRFNALPTELHPPPTLL